MYKIRYLLIALTMLPTMVSCNNQASSNEKFNTLSTIEISTNDRPEDYGSSLVAWYPELGKAIVGTHNQLKLQGANPRNNVGSVRVLETTKAAVALGMAVKGSGYATWGTGFASWGSGFATWGSGNGSVFSTGYNTDTWNQIRLLEGRVAFAKLGQGVKVAVIDTGIDLTHPAFASRLVPSSEQFDFVDNDTTPQEVPGEAYGHGTNIAGIIAQIAEKATIMPLRVLDKNGIGDGDNVIKAINWAVQKGARVINLSLGTYESEAVSLALDNATRQGIFVVTASGNSGDQNVNFPARNCGSNGKNGRWGDMAISVTSVDKLDRRSKFANFGKDDVGISAPGEFIYAPAPDNRIAAWSGTSMAAPMVSASLALALGERAYTDLQKIGKAIREKVEKIDKINPDNKDSIGKGRLDLDQFAQEVKKIK